MIRHIQVLSAMIAGLTVVGCVPSSMPIQPGTVLDTIGQLQTSSPATAGSASSNNQPIAPTPSPMVSVSMSPSPSATPTSGANPSLLGGGGGPAGGGPAAGPTSRPDMAWQPTIVSSLPPVVVPSPPSSFSVGAKIALVSNVDGNFEIYLANPNGSGLQRLTEDPGMDLYPNFTPDRREIVWCSNRAAGVFAIYRMWVDGSHPIKLTTGTAQATQPAVSPDGSKIAFVRWTGPSTSVISVMNRDGSGEVRMTPDGGQAFGPSWSPDGATLMFGSNHATPGVPVLYRMPAAGGTLTALTALNGAYYPVGRANWSPDGTRIVYSSVQGNGAPTLTVINADGSGRTTLSSTNDTDPVWSPDGSTLLYTSAVSGTSQLATISPTGFGFTTLTSGTISYAQPDW